MEVFSEWSMLGPHIIHSHGNLWPFSNYTVFTVTYNHIFICGLISLMWASLVAQLVKNLPAMRETWVQFLGWEDLLEKGKATHSRILAWRIPWTV